MNGSAHRVCVTCRANLGVLLSVSEFCEVSTVVMYECKCWLYEPGKSGVKAVAGHFLWQ